MLNKINVHNVYDLLILELNIIVYLPKYKLTQL